jgi:hypothetical protein
LLKVVQHEQHVLVAQISLEASGKGAIRSFVDTQCLGNTRCDQVRLVHWGQLDKVHSVAKIVEQAASDLDGQACLADPGRADEREQPVSAG